MKKGPNTFQSIQLNVCGNGVREEGEECDCGKECADNSCCDGMTCKLKKEAKCDDHKDSCCKNCQLMSSGSVCRPSIDPCDLEETCDRSSATCPSNKIQVDGKSCQFVNATKRPHIARRVSVQTGNLSPYLVVSTKRQMAQVLFGNRCLGTFNAFRKRH